MCGWEGCPGGPLSRSAHLAAFLFHLIPARRVSDARDPLGRHQTPGGHAVVRGFSGVACHPACRPCRPCGIPAISIRGYAVSRLYRPQVLFRGRHRSRARPQRARQSALHVHCLSESPTWRHAVAAAPAPVLPRRPTSGLAVRPATQVVAQPLRSVFVGPKRACGVLDSATANAQL